MSVVRLPVSLPARLNVAQNKQSVVLGVTLRSVCLKHDVTIRIFCDMAPFLVLNKIPTFRRNPTKPECIDIVDGDRILRNVDYDLPKGTA